MKLSCKRIDFTYTPGEEIFNFPEESGLPFIFDVEEELTGDPAGTRDAHRHSRGYRRVVFFLLGVLLIVVSIWGFVLKLK